MPTTYGLLCESIVSNDANQKGSLEEEGFVSDNADVPCRGHLGFFAVFQGEVNYADLVERGRELGLPVILDPLWEKTEVLLTHMETTATFIGA